MKNIVTITLIILSLLLVGVLYSYFNQSSVERLPSYLPQNLTTSQIYTLFQFDPLPTQRTLSIGPSEELEEEFDVISTQGQYLSEDRKLAMTISVEEIQNEDDFELYKQKVWERYTEPSRGGTSTQLTVDGYDVYLSFRTIEEGDDTSEMVIMGGGYVFIPETNVAISYSLYNPQLGGCEDMWNPQTCVFDTTATLPTYADDRSVAEQIVQHYRKSISEKDVQ